MCQPRLNTCMTEKLLVATYDQDLLQLEMFCYCINKNWQSNQFLTVVLNSCNDWSASFVQVEKILHEYLFGWQYEIVDGQHADHNGYREQAVNKILYSIDHRFDDCVIFDSKDFLLRPASIDCFKNNSQYRNTFILDQPHVDLYPEAKELLDTDISAAPAVLNLTPWIWNIQQLEKYWNYMVSRFGSYDKWDTMFKGGTESDTYYLYTLYDNNTEVKFLDRNSNPLIVGGGWTHQTYQGMLQEFDDFKKWDTRLIWKHSRKLEDPRCWDVTKSVLLYYDIDPVVVHRICNIKEAQQ
jgi:hypothetical protein